MNTTSHQGPIDLVTFLYVLSVASQQHAKQLHFIYLVHSNMGLRSYLANKREEKATAKAVKQERNDIQRNTQSLLQIALKKQTSLNSLTSPDRRQAHLDKQARFRKELKLESPNEACGEDGR